MADSPKKIFGEPGSGMLWMRCSMEASAKQGCLSIRINKDFRKTGFRREGWEIDGCIQKKSCKF